MSSNNSIVDTNAYYSHNNGYPKKLPFRIFLSDGSTRTDPSQFRVWQVEDAGYVKVDDMPQYDASIQSVSWNGSAWVLTDIPPPEPVIRKSLTKGEFLDRFDFSDGGEQDRIYDIIESKENNPTFRTIRKGWHRMMASGTVDVDFPTTIYLVNFMESEGILNYTVTYGDLNRANTILQPVITVANTVTDD